MSGVPTTRCRPVFEMHFLTNCESSLTGKNRAARVANSRFGYEAQCRRTQALYVLRGLLWTLAQPVATTKLQDNGGGNGMTSGY